MQFVDFPKNDPISTTVVSFDKLRSITDLYNSVCSASSIIPGMFL